MTEDVRERASLDHEGVVSLNFIRDPSIYVFRRHYRQGLRSHIMEVLKRTDVARERMGLEMEGGHYQRAISAAIIQGHVPESMKTRYAYYASDNPLREGDTLASGPLGNDGIVPTYMISKVILQKIINPAPGVV